MVTEDKPRPGQILHFSEYGEGVHEGLQLAPECRPGSGQLRRG